MPLPENSALFSKPRTALAGPGVLPVDKVSQGDHLDFGAELAILIKKDVLNVSEDEAIDYVLGFMSSDELAQVPAEHRWRSIVRLRDGLPLTHRCMGKGINNSCPIGPALVCPEKYDPDNVDVECWRVRPCRSPTHRKPCRYEADGAGT